MYRDPGRISLLAEILVEKHGVGAQAVAADRAHLWTEADGHEIADFWRAVGAAVRQLSQTRHDPPLPEVLDGAVTRATTDADGVSREDVEAVMFAARKKRQRTARRRHTNGRRHTNRRSSRRT